MLAASLNVSVIVLVDSTFAASPVGAAGAAGAARVVADDDTNVPFLKAVMSLALNAPLMIYMLSMLPRYVVYELSLNTLELLLVEEGAPILDWLLELPIDVNERLLFWATWVPLR